MSLLFHLLLLPYTLWVLFLAAITVYRAYLDKRLTRKAFYASIPLLAAAWFVDWIANWTWAILVFDEKPASAFELVTTRLTRYLNPEGREAIGQTYKYRRAKLICTEALDGFDPNPKGHCV